MKYFTLFFLIFPLTLFAQPSLQDVSESQYIQAQYQTYEPLFGTGRLTRAQVYEFLFTTVAGLENIPPSYRYMPVKMKGITPQQRKFLQKGLYLNFIRNNPFPLRLNEYMTTQEFKKLVEPFFMIPPEIISPKTHIRLEVIAEFLKKRYISESAEIPPQESDVYQQDFLEAQGLIQEKFYPLKNTTGSTSTKDLYIAATRGMTEGLNDQYSQYFSPKEAREFQESIQGNYAGIGVEIVPNERGPLEISQVFSESPALEAGIQKGDKILMIDKEEILPNTPIAKSIGKIRGEIGTSVHLSILRNGTTIPFTIFRKKITQETATGSDIGDGDTYIALRTFSVDAVRQILEKMTQKEEYTKHGEFIFDLRSNPGGDLHAATLLVSAFLPQNTPFLEFKTQQGTGVISTLESSYKIPSHRPIRILIDEHSASASEVVAVTLREQLPQRTKIFGQKSFGKGVIQEIFPLTSGAQVKLTIAEWCGAKNHTCIQSIGIIPDVVLQHQELQKKDPLLDPWVSAVRY